MHRDDLSHSFIGWFALLFNLYFDLLVCCKLFYFFPWGEGRGGGESNHDMGFGDWARFQSGYKPADLYVICLFLYI